MKKPRRPVIRGKPFELRHADHPKGADYDIDDNNCWIWKWNKDKDGYGLCYIDGKVTAVHRWMIRDLLTPEKPNALHISGNKPGISHNPSCINREHLYAGTQKENMADRKIDGTTHYGNTWGRGNLGNRRAKLTQDQALDIYHRAWNGAEKQVDIAREYGVVRSVVSSIRNGITWNWLTKHKPENKA